MDLKEVLGEELYNQVKEKAGDEHKIAIVSDGSYIPKDKFDAVNKEKNDYKKEIQTRDQQLEGLKKKAKDSEELQQEIDNLKQQNEDTKTEYEKQIQEQQFNFALKDQLTAAKVKNPKAVEALLNKEAIKLDGEQLLGLNEQIDKIKESDPYLFDDDSNDGKGNGEGNSKPSFTPGQHQRGNGDNAPKSLADALAQKFQSNQN